MYARVVRCSTCSSAPPFSSAPTDSDSACGTLFPNVSSRQAGGLEGRTRLLSAAQRCSAWLSERGCRPGPVGVRWSAAVPRGLARPRGLPQGCRVPTPKFFALSEWLIACQKVCTDPSRLARTAPRHGPAMAQPSPPAPCDDGWDQAEGPWPALAGLARPRLALEVVSAAPAYPITPPIRYHVARSTPSPLKQKVSCNKA